MPPDDQYDPDIAEAQREWDSMQAQLAAQDAGGEAPPPSAIAEKATALLILAVIFLPVIFFAGLETYVTFGGLMAMVLFVKPWWRRQETWDKDQEAWRR